jgi:phosphomevalonate kinase
MSERDAALPTVLAPGKVFLAGEYSVLAGGRAIVSTLGIHARASVVPAGRKREAQFVSAILRLLAPRIARSLARRKLGISLNLRPFRRGRVKLGVGSSAAGVAAVSGLVQVLQGGSVGRRDVLARRCAELHRNLQDGHGSGADAAASCRGGVIRFRMPATLSRVALPPWLRLVAIVLGHGGRTSRVLHRYTRMLDAPGGKLLGNLEIFAEAADRIMDGLDRQDWYSLRLGVNLTAAAYEELEDLISVELVTHHDILVMRASRRLGGVSRPSGAGGGDLHLAYFPEPEPAARFMQWASGKGYLALEVEPDDLGVRRQDP